MECLNILIYILYICIRLLDFGTRTNGGRQSDVVFFGLPHINGNWIIKRTTWDHPDSCYSTKYYLFRFTWKIKTTNVKESSLQNYKSSYKKKLIIVDKNKENITYKEQPSNCIKNIFYYTLIKSEGTSRIIILNVHIAKSKIF